MRDRPDSRSMLGDITIPPWSFTAATLKLIPLAEARAMADAIPGPTLP
jgi:hypothetical protein